MRPLIKIRANERSSVKWAILKKKKSFGTGVKGVVRYVDLKMVIPAMRRIDSKYKATILF